MEEWSCSSLVGDDDVGQWMGSGVLDDGGRQRHISMVTSGGARWVRSDIDGDDSWRMYGGGDELHRHCIADLMRVGDFRLRTNGLLRDKLGFRLRFGGPILVIHVTALKGVGPHSMANLIRSHIFNKRRNYNPLPFTSYFSDGGVECYAGVDSRGWVGKWVHSEYRLDKGNEHITFVICR